MSSFQAAQGHAFRKLFYAAGAVTASMRQGCQFSDLSLISDFFRIKETGIKLNKCGQNMDNNGILRQA